MIYYLIGYHVLTILSGYFAIVDAKDNDVELLLIPGMLALVIFVDGRLMHLLVLLNYLCLVSINYLRNNVTYGGLDISYVKLVVFLFISYATVYYFVDHFKVLLRKALSKSVALNHTLQKSEQELRAIAFKNALE